MPASACRRATSARSLAAQPSSPAIASTHPTISRAGATTSHRRWLRASAPQLACTLLSVLGVNWGYRLPDPQEAVLPVGILISALGLLMTTITGWHGGKLVFDYQIGTQQDHGN